ncbi:hypothetical protein [Yersinia ruckeri]|uniref:hypothetical protein n=1 Tax=Yersinia ruckeri TaxID=29486 RepID=UPI0020BDF506|nr:hypothetical protein [Yersinia ruckeri]MCK8586404.1 hypothetical protein [Yersinia ruckeri]MCW6615646.1 hypothetical protein [Yersinia ruckeri]
MSYRVYLTYENGRRSHQQFSRNRKVILQHLESVFADLDLRETAKELVLEYKYKPLFVCAMSTVNDETMSRIEWPRNGNKRTLRKPKIACLSMPSQMYDFLKELGGGSASKAVQDMCLKQMGDDVHIDDMYYSRHDTPS